jgi:formate dehydrogenase maturation protein FdhE
VASRKHNLKHRYGITEDDYHEMVEKQQCKCKICGSQPNRPLFVDHCHKTKQVRGLLCHQCNVALGHMNDDPIRMEREANYLRSA